MDHFGHFLLTFVHSIVNIARFARNVELDFFCNFQTLWRRDLCYFCKVDKNEKIANFRHEICFEFCSINGHNEFASGLERALAKTAFLCEIIREQQQSLFSQNWPCAK